MAALLKTLQFVKAWLLAPVPLGVVILWLGGWSQAHAGANELAKETPAAALVMQIQVAARQHFEHHRINGYWYFIDHAQQRPSKLKPDFSSPKFYRIGDYYAVRYLFLDPKDAARPIIFYMTRRRAAEFVIIHVDVADDKPLEFLVRNKVASPLSVDPVSNR